MRRGLYTCAVILLSGYLLIPALPSVAKAIDARPGDCTIHWLAARSFWRGASAYSDEQIKMNGLESIGYAAPPTVAFWFLPYARFEVDDFGKVANYLTLLVFITYLFLIAWENRLYEPLPTALLLLALVLPLSWMAYHFRMAQLSIPIAFACALSFWLLRRGRDIESGIALGCACTLKLFPGLLVLYLAYSRRWRAVLAAAGVYLVIAIVMTSRFGISSWWRFLEFERPVAATWLPSIQNASIYGIWHHLARPACGLGGFFPAHWAKPLSLITVLWTLAGYVWLLRRSRSEARFEIGYFTAMLLSVFLNPFAWEHYLAIWLAPAAALAVILYRRRADYPRWFVALATVLFLVAAGALFPDIGKKGAALVAYRRGQGSHAAYHVWELLNCVPWLFGCLIGLGQLAFARKSP